MKPILSFVIQMVSSGIITIVMGCGHGIGLEPIDTEGDSEPEALSGPEPELGLEDSLVLLRSGEYVCEVDIVNQTHSCDAQISVDQDDTSAKVTADLTGYRAMSLTVDVCKPSGYILNIGNSPGNDGGSGDYGEFSNDSELCILKGGMLFVFENDYSEGDNGEEKMLYVDEAYIETPECQERQITISDGEVDLHDHGTILSSDQVFRLNQPDDAGEPDALLFIGINRVVNDRTTAIRNGSGVQRVEISLLR